MLTTDNDDARDSRDGRPRIADIEVTAPDGVLWDNLAQQLIMAVFLPPDAKFQSEQAQGPSVPLRSPVGDERVYVSAQLAATFTADYFMSGTGLTVAPGTFSDSCELDAELTGTFPAVPTNAEGTANDWANDCFIAVGSL
jgi:hypothetical protein